MNAEMPLYAANKFNVLNLALNFVHIKLYYGNMYINIKAENNIVVIQRSMVSFLEKSIKNDQNL